MTHCCHSIDRPALRRAAFAAWGCMSALPAHAFFLEGEALDTAANVLALIVIVLVPITAIVLFWMVHVLPEKIAHRRNHPQRDAIRMLCLLSLVFGGLLWPLAWLWAYSKPVLYKLAYGTDTETLPQRPEPNPRAETSEIPAELASLRRSIDAILSRDGAPGELAAIRDQVAALERRPNGELDVAARKVEELH